MISICCSITVQYEAALLGELSFKAPGLNLLLQALIPSSRVIDSTLPVCLTSITSFAETNKPGSLYKWVLLISSGTFRNLHRIAASRKATRYFQAEAPSHLPLSILWRGGGGGITQLPVSIWHRRVSDLPPSFPWQVQDLFPVPGNLGLQNPSCFLSTHHQRAAFHHILLELYRP